MKMCWSAADVRNEAKLAFWDELCKKCQDKVSRKLQGTNKTLFSYCPQEYGFCRRCLKEIRRINARLDEYNF